MSQTIYIIIPVFNRLHHTIDCIDDASTDGTGDYIRAHYPDVVVLTGDGNLWWTGGINLCLDYVLDKCQKSDLVLTLNNDVVVGPEYLGNMIEAHKLHPDALIGSLAVFTDDPNKIETAESVHNWATAKKGYKNKFGEEVTDKHHGLVHVPKLCGKGVLIPLKVFSDIGKYDQLNFPHYAADEDFSMRAAAAGYEVLINFDGRVRSDYESTGLGTRHTRPLVGEFVKSLFSRRSPNNLLIKWRLTLRHCPWYLIPQHVVFDLIRTIGGFMRRLFSYYIK